MTERDAVRFTHRCWRPRCTAPRPTRGADSFIGDWPQSSPKGGACSPSRAERDEGGRGDGVYGRAGCASRRCYAARSTPPGSCSLRPAGSRRRDKRGAVRRTLGRASCAARDRRRRAARACSPRVRTAGNLPAAMRGRAPSAARGGWVGRRFDRAGDRVSRTGARTAAGDPALSARISARLVLIGGPAHRPAPSSMLSGRSAGKRRPGAGSALVAADRSLLARPAPGADSLGPNSCSAGSSSRRERTRRLPAPGSADLVSVHRRRRSHPRTLRPRIRLGPRPR